MGHLPVCHECPRNAGGLSVLPASPPELAHDSSTVGDIMPRATTLTPNNPLHVNISTAIYFHHTQNWSLCHTPNLGAQKTGLK